MFIWIVIIIIALISVGLSLLSLKHIKDKKYLNNAKKEFSMNRTLFQDPSDSRGE